MHKIIREVKTSHLGYIQEELAKLTNLAITKDHKQVFIKEDTETFEGKEQLRVHTITNDSNVWNKAIHELIEINEFAIKDRPEGYQQQNSTKFSKGKETRFYVIILNTDKYSLYYGFAYRTNL